MPEGSSSHHAESKSMFEKLYQKERQKSKLLLGAVVILSVLLVSSWVLGLSKLKSVAANQPPGLSQNGMGPGGGFGGGQGRRNLSPKTFLKSDGSVDTDKVKSVTDNVPADFKDRLLSRVSTQIDSSVSSGEITQAQADALKSAFGITSGTNSNTGGTSGTL